MVKRNLNRWNPNFCRRQSSFLGPHLEPSGTFFFSARSLFHCRRECLPACHLWLSQTPRNLKLGRAAQATSEKMPSFEDLSDCTRKRCECWSSSRQIQLLNSKLFDQCLATIGISAAKKKEEFQIAGPEESTGLPTLHHELVGPNMVLVWFGTVDGRNPAPPWMVKTL